MNALLSLGDLLFSANDLRVVVMILLRHLGERLRAGCFQSAGKKLKKRTNYGDQKLKRAYQEEARLFQWCLVPDSSVAISWEEGWIR